MRCRIRLAGFAAVSCALLLLATGTVLPAAADFYWESPVVFSPSQGRFPVAAGNGTLSVVAWQESSGGTGENESLTVRVSVGIKRTGSPWRIRRNIGGSYLFSGAEPAILSAVVDGRGRILIAAAASPTETEVLVSDDGGETFSRHRVDGTADTSLAPRIYARSDGGYLLFVTRGVEQSLSIFYSRSDDGRAWTPFQPFISESGLRLNFLPSHASLGGRDYVVFQSLTGAVRPSFQLFLKSSADGGKTWTAARQVTDFMDPYATARRESENFDNQRPHLSSQGDTLFLAWERRAGVGAPQVYAAELREDGAVIGQADRLTQGGAYTNNPVSFRYGNESAVVWFDNRRGRNRVYLARRLGIDWQDGDLSGSSGGDASFARPVVDGDGLFVFWQAPQRGIDRIYLLEPDTTVAAPVLRGVNFQSGVRVRRDTASIAWQAPDDPSGIAGYSFSWSMDPSETPPKRLMAYSAATSAERRADEDGTWYFSIRAQDYAGNWSEPTVLEFLRDTTPPPAANLILPPGDGDGYLASNTFTLRWNPPPASDIAGYAWNLEYLASGDGYRSLRDDAFLQAVFAAFPSPSVPPRNMGPDTSASFVNRDDGLWRFVVSAVDSVGNIGPPSVAYFRTNKYVPYTYVTYADAERDEQGLLSLRIIGRGFSDGGRVGRVFLDRDGREPYDREFLLERGEYAVPSDREIRDLRVEDLDEGLYRIGVVHPLRGLHLTAPLVRVDETGTVKFGDYSRVWAPSWSRSAERRFVFDWISLAIAAVAVFGALGLTVSIRGIGAVVAESAAIRMEAVALITGDSMPSEKNRRLKAVRRRGSGLRLKLASFTIFLVIIVVTLVSAPLSLMMTRTQEATLLQGLRDRSRVLLESLASGARAYLPSRNVLELGFLPSQTEAVPEARYATITGFGSSATVFNDHVWATNDPDIESKIDTAEFQAGTSRLQDVLSPRLESIARELDERARTEVGDLSESIAALTREGLSLALRTDGESIRRRDDIQTTTRTLEARLNERLSTIAAEIGSEPAFPSETLPSDGTRVFVFFKPVMYRQGAEDIYFRGLVRLEVSIDSIVESVAAGRRELLRVTALVALAALAMGVAGALLLSTLIIRPIKKLVGHVEMIRDTEDKAKLEGKDIVIKSKDEIAILGSTINDMTHGLVKAALASQDLTIGKEVQKKFIPLETDSMGNKLTCGHTDVAGAEFFGYYEGAKGVSGDYFDYRDLDGRYYAIIKCDVAGKGIPAALIMIQVATMFLSYFKNWKPTAEGMRIERVVYQINDFIETLGFKGRFAAFTLCLFDSKTGLVRFCNAGDNIVHWYDASERMLKTTELPQTPATGVLPNDLVDMKGGYTVQTLTLDRNDILMLYTDGIEEAKRRFRDPSFKEILCAHGGAAVDTPHENHSVGQGDEEMGYDRVKAIVEAVLGRSKFVLRKHHNPEGDAPLEFDFGSCSGTVEETIMAMVSVEKVFRMYRDPKAGEDARVLVDRRVDAFLKSCFRQYRDYCSHTKEHPEHKEYLYYTHIREDEQYDDLTILGIRKK